MKFENSALKHIIIVDDDFSCQLALDMMLKKLLNGVDIKTFKEGNEALIYVNKYPVDLIFTDITMPGMTGDQLAIKIREKNDKIPIIGISGLEPNERYMKIFDVVLTKPINSECLNDLIQRIFSH